MTFHSRWEGHSVRMAGESDRPTASPPTRLSLSPLEVAEVAHELGNAIAGVLGSLSILQRAVREDEIRLTPSRLREHIDGAQCSAQLAHRLIDRLRTSPPMVASTRCDLARALDRAISVVRPQAPIRARISALYAPGPVVMGREDDLVRAFVNLLLNAVEATAPGRANDIRIRTRSEGEWVRVIVEDTGTGMGDTSARSSTHGPDRGLGLTIVERIAGEHGGRLSIESVHGDGTSVTLELRLSEEPA